ncbi:Rrf2 family transcriptional regulator [Adlercreutzia sp. ZJ138]|uniref:RrF2 family transcriptional regulator n=1 Tax=Adlercreutzia sp. ZJ138 TaxID=2709405 RepID=UPI0013EA5630|nr:Rrf2 family transcriptional regulator [Adlercreutzia sp. ZJ138]
MDITKRSDYAFRMLRAAYDNLGTLVSVADVAKTEDIPYSFARSIQHDLVKGGLLKTARGSSGGFSLACDPRTTTLLDVVEAVQGPVVVAPCSSHADLCAFSDGCAYNQLWAGASAMLNAYFASITLHDLFCLKADHPSIRRAKAGAGFKACIGSGVGNFSCGDVMAVGTPNGTNSDCA